MTLGALSRGHVLIRHGICVLTLTSTRFGVDDLELARTGLWITDVPNGFTEAGFCIQPGSRGTVFVDALALTVPSSDHPLKPATPRTTLTAVDVYQD